MDREAAVIRAEMTHTRASLDRKISLLEDRARDLSPRRYWARNKPEFLVEHVVGGALTLVGVGLAWSHLRNRRRRRERMRAALVSYGRW